MVIWVTGMSGAGKTTLCNAVWNLVKPSIPELVLLDGDQVRELFGADLDYSEPSRERQIARLRRLARFHWPSLRHSCRSELTRQGISLP